MKIQEEFILHHEAYNKPIPLVDGLFFSQKEQIKTTEYYSNSKTLNNNKDLDNKEVPFMQILNAVCDVENAAKDLDTKDIEITSDNPNHYTRSNLLRKDVYNWMKESDFAKTLNDMRNTHTRYGSLLVKKCIEKDEESNEKELKIDIPEWKNLITDQVDILGGIIVEIHYMTALQIQKKTEWDISPIMEKLKKGGSQKRIPVYEVRGEFSKATFKESNGEKPTDTDEKTFSYQLYYLAGLPKETGDSTLQIDDLHVLYSEDDTERVYKYLARKPKSGRSYGVGVFEEGEQAQIWTNDIIQKQHKAMEYSTKVISQSASKKLKNRNLFTETDNGVILETEDGKPIMPVNLLPSGGLAQFQNIAQQWYNQLEKTTSAYAAQRGENPQSGTPYRLQATVLQQSSSVFKDLQQEMGIFITEIMEDWVIPHLATKLNKAHILASEFSPEELMGIDESFAKYHVAEDVINHIEEKGVVPTFEELQGYMDGYKKMLQVTKSRRFLDIPKGYYKDIETKVTVNVTGEQRNKAVILETLNNLLATYTSHPEIASDPVAMKFIMEIVEISGSTITPFQISSALTQKINQIQQQPQQQTQVPEAPKPDKLSLEALAPASQ